MHRFSPLEILAGAHLTTTVTSSEVEIASQDLIRTLESAAFRVAYLTGCIINEWRDNVTADEDRIEQYAPEIAAHIKPGDYAKAVLAAKLIAHQTNLTIPKPPTDEGQDQ